MEHVLSLFSQNQVKGILVQIAVLHKDLADRPIYPFPFKGKLALECSVNHLFAANLFFNQISTDLFDIHGLSLVSTLLLKKKQKHDTLKK